MNDDEIISIVILSGMSLAHKSPNVPLKHLSIIFLKMLRLLTSITVSGCWFFYHSIWKAEFWSIFIKYIL